MILKSPNSRSSGPCSIGVCPPPVNSCEPSTRWSPVTRSSPTTRRTACRFVHFMAFEGDATEQLHRNTPHVQRFVKALYPNCELVWSSFSAASATCRVLGHPSPPASRRLDVTAVCQSYTSAAAEVGPNGHVYQGRNAQVKTMRELSAPTMRRAPRWSPPQAKCAIVSGGSAQFSIPVFTRPCLSAIGRRRSRADRLLLPTVWTHSREPAHDIAVRVAPRRSSLLRPRGGVFENNAR